MRLSYGNSLLKMLRFDFRKDYDQLKTNPQEEIIRQTVSVAEEMFTLLIYLLSMSSL